MNRPTSRVEVWVTDANGRRLLTTAVDGPQDTPPATPGTIDEALITDLAAQWDRAAEQARQTGRNPRTSASSTTGDAVATSLIGCAQALRNLLDVP